MVFQYALSAIGGLGQQAIGGTVNPIFDLMNQELSKIIPVKKAQVRTLIVLKYRKVITDEIFYERMSRYGFDKNEADAEFKAAEFFPSVNDSIRLAVREADRDDIAAEFGTDSEFDQLPLDDFHKAGITPAQLKRFWRAHWDLPGTSQVFEMFQRLNESQLAFKTGDLAKLDIEAKDVKMDLDDVRRFLKVADVMPFWRDKLSMIAYRPISRIDIRRLEDFGLLTLEELEFRNREIGYSPEDAEFLAKWTVINNEFKDIKALMKQNAVTKDEAVQLLIEAGANKDDAERLVLRILPKVKKEKLAEDKALTRAEFLRAYRVGIRERQEVKDALIEMNYDEEEAEFLLELEDIKLNHKIKETKAREKNLSKSDIMKSFKQGTTTKSQALEKLQEIGYDEEEAEFIMDIAKIDKEKAGRARK